jgi:hypothetical protein
VSLIIISDSVAAGSLGDFELVRRGFLFIRGGGEYNWGSFSKLCLKVGMNFSHYVRRVSSKCVLFSDYLVQVWGVLELALHYLVLMYKVAGPYLST